MRNPLRLFVFGKGGVCRFSATPDEIRVSLNGINTREEDLALFEAARLGWKGRAGRHEEIEEKFVEDLMATVGEKLERD
jgi:hypothetical protein